MKKYFEIRIVGKGDFPLDMLRYSRCWPVDLQSVENMTTNDNNFTITRPVRVAFIGNEVEAAHCLERFESFNWRGAITVEERNYS